MHFKVFHWVARGGWQGHFGDFWSAPRICNSFMQYRIKSPIALAQTLQPLGEKTR
jgi:hypothetical protein